jgi:hypothetical protein
MVVLASAEGVAWISVGGAIVVAGITAVTTNRRQRESLAHDRELAELDDLRRLLDQASLALHMAGNLREDMESSLRAGLLIPDEEISAAVQRGDALFELNARINVRLGTEHPIAIGFEEASDSFYLTWTATRSGKGASREGILELADEVRDLGIKFSGGLTAFELAAVERVGTVNPRR